MNPRFYFPLLSANYHRRLVDENARVLSHYKWEREHIHAWDPLHFSRLVATVGFKIRVFLPIEGMPLPGIVRKLGLPLYVFPKGRLKNYSYTMAFLLIKVSESYIRGND